MTIGWVCRATRTAVFAAVCALLAALGHRMLSGSTVPWWAAAAALVGAGGMAWCLTGRERGFPLVVSVAMAAQAGSHVWYSLAQTATRPHPPNPATPTAHHHAMADSTPLEHVARSGHLGHDMSGMSSTDMVAAHILAALLCSMWLAYGERAAFRILRLLAEWLVAPLRLPLLLPAPPHRPRIRTHRNRSAPRPWRFLLIHAISSRGPPTGTAVV
ncbi:hypothetical protein [Streptomyces sp. NPDC052042]|uniref:hypothetical protein n=1 Tax=Streptomyces sp. NPDC052042 TaxID=3365683 RepID=UPI0037D818B6